MKKVTVAILALATMLASVWVLPGFQPATAYVSTQVQTGQVFCDNIWPGSLEGKYGCVTRYDFTGGEYVDCTFWSSIEAKGVSQYDFISDAKITVTGTKPNGQAISGGEFTNLDCLTSPNLGGGTEWADALSYIADYITPIDPTGISDYIANAIDNVGPYETLAVDNDYNSAWAEYQSIWTGPPGHQEKGLQFRFVLHCDPALGGTYTLTIHYHLEFSHPAYPYGTWLLSSDDFYETITYEYTPPHVSSITGSGPLSGSGSVSSATNMIGYEADSNYAVIEAPFMGDAAYITGRLNTEVAGQRNIYLYGYAWGSDASHVYVYVSQSGYGDWIYVNDLNIYPSSSQPIHIGTITSTFRYIAICSYNDYAFDPTALLIDCVTTT